MNILAQFLFITSRYKAAQSQKNNIRVKVGWPALFHYFAYIEAFTGWVVSCIIFILQLQAMKLSYVISNDVFWLDFYGHVSDIYNILSQDVPSPVWHIKIYAHMFVLY